MSVDLLFRFHPFEGRCLCQLLAHPKACHADEDACEKGDAPAPCGDCFPPESAVKPDCCERAEGHPGVAARERPTGEVSASLGRCNFSDKCYGSDQFSADR